MTALLDLALRVSEVLAVWMLVVLVVALLVARPRPRGRWLYRRCGTAVWTERL